MHPLARPCSLLLLSLTGLVSCQSGEADRAPDPTRRIEHTLGPATTYGDFTPREEAEGELLSELDMVRDIERGELEGTTPQDPISIYRGRKKYRFANVRQLRANIRYRWDSLKAAGHALDYDTTYKPLHR